MNPWISLATAIAPIGVKLVEDLIAAAKATGVPVEQLGALVTAAAKDGMATDARDYRNRAATKTVPDLQLRRRLPMLSLILLVLGFCARRPSFPLLFSARPVAVARTAYRCCAGVLLPEPHRIGAWTPPLVTGKSALLALWGRAL